MATMTTGTMMIAARYCVTKSVEELDELGKLDGECVDGDVIGNSGAV